MQIKLLSGPIIQTVQKLEDNSFELQIKFPDGRIENIKMNPDEFKWFALDVHRTANRAI